VWPDLLLPKAVTNYLLCLRLPGPTLHLWIHHLGRVSELRSCVGDMGVIMLAAGCLIVEAGSIFFEKRPRR
jgi:hypothetical protein